MKNTVRFEGLSLPVSDVGRSVAFYCLCGFTVEVQRGSGFALLRLGENTIGLLRTNLIGWSREARAFIHIELSTDNLDALYAELQERGIQFHQPPHDYPWERSMATYDPDGYTIEFAQGRRGANL
jgi:catechol 2,3-dioxygenase-like lactoylglutathione lyase family enzyme